MDLKRFTGPQAGSQKYDLLTAMAIAGLNGTSGLQTSMLRLVALVTARYNWKLDEVSVGQRDLARMWSVDERTVKREIKRLIEARIFLQLRPGVRGRVAAYRLNQEQIYQLSAPHWQQVGPDFVARMGASNPVLTKPEEKVVKVDFRAASSEKGPLSWQQTLQGLAEAEPELHRNWFSGLTYQSFDGGVLILKAPSAFVGQYIVIHHMQRLLGVAGLEYRGLRRIQILA